jgi:hypothetical protein
MAELAGTFLQLSIENVAKNQLLHTVPCLDKDM